MQGLNDIIFLLNDFFKTGIFEKSKVFLNYRIFGVTDLIKSGEQTYPAVFANKNGEYAGIDDAAPVIIYHRANTVTIAEPPRTGYGDNRTKLVSASFAMTMVVYLDEKVACMKSDELLLILLSNIPEVMDVLNFEYVNVKISSAILNTQQVFQNEYKGVQYFLNPESSLMSVNYTLEGRFKRGCFNYCPEV